MLFYNEVEKYFSFSVTMYTNTTTSNKICVQTNVSN